jgi:hypothetical protein
MASNPLDWKVTISFRPIRAFVRLVLLTSILAVCWLPLNKVERAQGAPSEPSLTTEQAVYVMTRPVEEVKRETAVAVVQKVLDVKMPHLSESKREALAKTVVSESLACNLDPLFSLAVSEAESGFDHEAVSVAVNKEGKPYANAKGMYQLIDATWKLEVKRRDLGPVEKFNVVDNAKVGIGYLCYLATSFKRPDSLLLAYNQGPGTATAILKGEATGDDQVPRYAPSVWASYKGLLASQGLPHDPKSMRVSYRKPEATIYVTQLHRPYDPTETTLLVAAKTPPPAKPVLKTPIPQPAPTVVAATTPPAADVSADVVPPPQKVYEGTDFRCKPGLEKFRYHDQVRCLSPDTAKDLNLVPFATVASSDD